MPPFAPPDCLLLPDLGRRVLVMGILNVTPDSFSDGGLHSTGDDALRHARAMVAAGADIVDIGGESTRPGHMPVDAGTEIARIVPIVTAVTAMTDKPVSIDTYKSATARAALAAGARIVNDVYGLQRDPRIAEVAAEFSAPVVVMHHRAAEDAGIDILDDMRRFFDRSLDIARRSGIKENDIILDPGFGFGKTDAQHFEILRRLPELKAMGFPILIGASRKRMVGRIVNRPPTERLAGTLAVHTLAAVNGADIVRVHDVAEHADAMRIVDAHRLHASGEQ